VGENGSGKVDGSSSPLAEAYGLNPAREGSAAVAACSGPGESRAGIGSSLVVEARGRLSRSHWALLSPRDTMHGLYHLPGEDNPGLRPGNASTSFSHGEGFLQMLRTRVNQPRVLPHGRSQQTRRCRFTACLGPRRSPARTLAEGRSQGGWVATHSPMDRRDPGRAPILELGGLGASAAGAGGTSSTLVRHWRLFLSEPDSYFRRPAVIFGSETWRAPARLIAGFSGLILARSSCH